MKTAISVPDDVFAEAERLTRRLKKSRSQLYTEAIREYVARHDPEAITAALDALCQEPGDAPDPFVAAAAQRVLAATEW